MKNTRTPNVITVPIKVQEQIVSDYKNNVAPKTILIKYNINKGVMRRIFKLQGIKPKRAFKQDSIKSQLNNILNDLETALPIEKIAIKYKTNTRQIKKIIKEYIVVVVPPHIKHFLSSRGFDNSLDWLREHNDWDKFIFVVKLKRRSKDWNWTTEYYKKFIDFIYYDKAFNLIYDKWKLTGDRFLRPSLDHIIPISKGGTNDISNFQILTWFENQTKMDKTQEEWNYIKTHIHDYINPTGK